MTALFLICQVFFPFFLMGRRPSGTITAAAGTATVSKRDSFDLNRIQMVKESYKKYDRDPVTSIESLEDGKKKLLSTVSGATYNSEMMNFISNRLAHKHTPDEVAPLPVNMKNLMMAEGVYLLLVALPSAPKGFDKRHLVRETWFKKYQNTTLATIRFVVGTLNLSDEIKNGLVAENKKYQDLILLEELLDSYGNLTRKTLYTFIWTAYNIRFLYLLKCDDDTYPHLGRVLYELVSRRSIHGLYWGYFLKNAPVRREGKWADAQWSLGKYYIKFAIGGAYIISRDLINLLVNNALYLQFFINEDVAVGSWLAPFNIERKHDPRFCRFFQKDPCTTDSVMSLGLSDDDILYMNLDR